MITRKDLMKLFNALSLPDVGEDEQQALIELAQSHNKAQEIVKGLLADHPETDAEKSERIFNEEGFA